MKSNRYHVAFFVMSCLVVVVFWDYHMHHVVEQTGARPGPDHDELREHFLFVHILGRSRINVLGLGAVVE